MSRLLPLRPSIDYTPRPRSVVDLSDEDSAAVLSALQSATARAILAALDREPATASDLSGRVDTSLQNVQYHLDKLREAGLVTAVGAWTSTKGRSMTVYAPTSARVELRLSGGQPMEPPDPLDYAPPPSPGEGSDG